MPAPEIDRARLEQVGLASDERYAMRVIDGDTPWILDGTADNTAVTLTQAAVAGKTHYVTGIHVGYSAANIKTVLLNDGVTLIGTFHIHNQRSIIFDRPVPVTTGALLEIVLAASGTAAVIGSAVLTGFTR